MAHPAAQLRWPAGERKHENRDRVEAAVQHEVRRQHKRIRGLLREVRRHITLKDPCALARLRMQLRELARWLPQHFELEEAASSLRWLVSIAPDLAYRAARLRGHHAALSQEVQSLVDFADAIEHQGEIEQLAARLVPFVRTLEAHEVEERRLASDLRARERAKG